jgi:hypothetical protein
MHPATPSMGASPSPERWRFHWRFHQQDEYLMTTKMGIHLEISPTMWWIKTLCTGNPSIFHCRVGAPACSTTAKSVTDAKPGPFHVWSLSRWLNCYGVSWVCIIFRQMSSSSTTQPHYQPDLGCFSMWLSGNKPVFCWRVIHSCQVYGYRHSGWLPNGIRHWLSIIDNTFHICWDMCVINRYTLVN